MTSRKYRILEFGVVIIVGVLVYCINILSVANNTTYRYAIEVWNYGRSFLNVLYPVIFTAPFCWLLFYEQNSSYWQYIYNRTMLKSYLRRRGITLIGLSSIAMFIVSVGGFVFAYIVEPIGRVLEYEPMMTYLFLGTFQIENPVVYVLVLSCWRGVLAGLYTLFSITITLSTKNIFVAMTSAFVYSIMENFILAVLQVPELSICTSFYPNRLTGSAISYGKLAVGPIILLVITLLTYFYNKWKYKR